MTRLGAPPTCAPTPRPNLRANGESNPRQVMREAAHVAADLGLALSQARIRVVVARYLGSGTDLGFRTWFLAYADPTGEQAVRNVMRDAL